MKWTIAVLFALVIAVGALSVVMDAKLWQKLDGEFAYADSLMVVCDSDPGLAWTKVAQDAHATRTIMATWISKQPWRDEMRAHAVATNRNTAYCQFLHAKVESLAGKSQ